MWDLLQEAQIQLAAAVAAANDALDANPLTPLIAQQVTGSTRATVRVDSLGIVQVYSPDTKEKSSIRGYSSELGTIGELRQRAKEVGLDPAPFGRKKRELTAAIEQAVADLASRPKRVVEAPALATRVFNPDAPAN